MEEARRAAALLRAQFGARRVFAFGSVCTGAFHARSDIDLAIEGVPPELFFKAGAAAARLVSRELNLIELETCSERLRRHVLSEGVPL